mgnify:FL=1
MRKKACRRADGRQKRRKTGLSEKPGKFWVLPPVPAETMDSQGNLTYPKPGFTVTDSRGLAPHSPLRQTAAGESISLYRFRWYYITYIFKMQVFFIPFSNFFHMYKKSAVSGAYLRRRKLIFLFSLPAKMGPDSWPAGESAAPGS